ncbi:uncharacterized protein LOC116712161 [Xiphophorus hellerii]|uniref:uncharacterized protein LOC116712161 n=1 Tax=Xiphophorus hellerii TaxID=8084 RepID=UPI0013B373E7|nr:uncharacterized protein LOC116712161 [Xiphophorus hellerii]XP_032407947.1 uncharacterized protein LOC116712161 [Xiphophorus hellerii]
MGFHERSFQTEVPSSFPRFGKVSVLLLMHLFLSRPVFIPRPTVKLNGSIKTLRPPSAASPPPTPPTGPDSFLGWSTLTTATFQQLPVCHHLKHPLVINPLYYPQRKKIFQSLPSVTTFAVAVWNTIVHNLNQTAARNKRQADCKRRPAPVYTPGQQVWLSSRDIPLKSISKKLSPRYIGPFPIAAVISPSAVRLRLPASLRVHPTFHVSQINPVQTSTLCPPAEPPPPPCDIDGHPAYDVRRIVDSRRRGRGRQYLVDWEGYGPEERSWIPGSFILDRSLISDYRSSLPSSSSRPPGSDR